MPRKTLPRLATVTDAASPLCGQRFLVQRWWGGTWYCWGQVWSHRGARTTHEESVRFSDSQVTVEDYAGDRVVLASQLFDQALQDMRRRGAIVSGRGRILTIERQPFPEPFVAVAKELGVDLRHAAAAELAAVAELAGEGGRDA